MGIARGAKEGIFDTVETILNSLDVLLGMLSSIPQVNKAKYSNPQRMIFKYDRTGRLFG